MKSRSGLVFDVPRSLQFIFKDIFLHRAYAPAQLLRHLPRDPVVLDLGANAGFFSLFALHVRPQARVLSFEPMPANYRLLQKNHALQRNRNWSIFHEAVSDQSGSAWLQFPDELQPSTTASLLKSESTSPGNRVKVKTRTLEEILGSETSGKCDWLKIDVEGYEYDILYHLPERIFRKIRTMAIEADPVDNHRKQKMALASFLEEMNFSVLLADDAVLYALNRSFG